LLVLVEITMRRTVAPMFVCLMAIFIPTLLSPSSALPKSEAISK
jgi:hypothetical protein